MPGKPVQILLVEDNAGDALLMTTLLERQDPSLDIRLASDGQAAMDFLNHHISNPGATRPDAVILDINLPRKNGFEVLSEIRSQPKLASLPVFMLTGSRAKEDLDKASSLGAVSFIIKPSGLPEFQEMIKRFLQTELPLALHRP